MTIDAQPPADLLRRLERNWPDAVTPVSQMMLRIFRLNKIVRENARRRVNEFGLSFTEFEVLATLRREPTPHRLVPTVIYDAVQITSGGLTKVLHGLQARGLIERSMRADDRRSKPVALTDEGRRLVEQAMARILATDGEILARGLNAVEMRTMIALLHQLLSALEPESEGSAETSGDGTKD